MNTALQMSDLVTEEIEAVMRERDEAEGLSVHRPGWRFGAFERAYADPSVKREAGRRALLRLDAILNPPPDEPDQRELWGGEE